MKIKEDHMYFDGGTIWEMFPENREKTFKAISIRAGKKIKNVKEFNKVLKEYLEERGIISEKIKDTIIYYRRDPKLYEKYKKFCLEDGYKIESEDTFFEVYVQQLYEKMLLERVEG